MVDLDEGGEISSMVFTMKKTSFRSVRPGCRWIGAAAFLSLAAAAHADDLSYNTGSLGTAGDGTHVGNPELDQPGALTVFDDHSVAYTIGRRTTVPFLAENESCG